MVWFNLYVTWNHKLIATGDTRNSMGHHVTEVADNRKNDTFFLALC